MRLLARSARVQRHHGANFEDVCKLMRTQTRPGRLDVVNRCADNALESTAGWLPSDAGTSMLRKAVPLSGGKHRRLQRSAREQI